MVEERVSTVPRHAGTGCRNIVAIQGRDRNAADVAETERAGKRPIVGLNRTKYLLGIVDKIHFVDGQHDPANPKERDDEAMPARLREHALAGIDKYNGEFGGRRPGRHITGVLLMARRIGNDELAPVGGERTIGHINGNTLLALGSETINQKSKIELAALCSQAFRISFERGELIFEQHLGFIEQASDQRGLSIIDAAAGNETQKILALLRAQISFNSRGLIRATQH